ncbi:MAG: phosphatase PAP2 family protein [Acidobacteriota bacterium]
MALLLGRTASLGIIVWAGLFAGSASLFSQSGPHLPDAPRPGAAMDALPQPPPDAARVITFRSLPRDFLHDQKEIWLSFPGQLAHGKHWVPVLAVSAVTAGLVFADKYEMPYFRAHQGQWDDTNDVFDSYIATGEVAAVPAGLLIAGFARHDEHEVNTALLATDAYADSAIVDVAMKAVTRRARPSAFHGNTPFDDTFYKGASFGSSFPSGHATAVFSIATVVARRYAKKRWVPVLAYGMATAISLSRITQLAHFPSDVFLGGALGYTIARYQVLRPQ